MRIAVALYIVGYVGGADNLELFVAFVFMFELCIEFLFIAWQGRIYLLTS